jgi:hypothetical protein
MNNEEIEKPDRLNLRFKCRNCGNVWTAYSASIRSKRQCTKCHSSDNDKVEIFGKAKTYIELQTMARDLFQKGYNVSEIREQIGISNRDVPGKELLIVLGFKDNEEYQQARTSIVGGHPRKIDKEGTGKKRQRLIDEN